MPSHNDLTKRTSVAGLQSFKDLYEQIPAKLSRTMSKNLSIPIAFVCLLHLANEKVIQVRILEPGLGTFFEGQKRPQINIKLTLFKDKSKYYLLKSCCLLEIS